MHRLTRQLASFAKHSTPAMMTQDKMTSSCTNGGVVNVNPAKRVQKFGDNLWVAYSALG